MKLTWCIASLLFLSVTDGVEAAQPEPHEVATVSAPVLARTIPLPGVAGPIDNSGFPGRIDHLAYDASTQRLFVACIANGSLEVVDLDLGKRIKSVGGLKRPQSVAITGRPRLVIVSTGGDGMVHVLTCASLQEKATMPVGEDADNVRIAPNGKVYVSFGGDKGPGGLAEFDPATLARTGTIPLPLRSESFQFDPSGTRLFSNQPGQKRARTDGIVVAVDVSSKKVQWTATLQNTTRNFPMTIDAMNHRLFVASRLPPKLIVINDRAVQSSTRPLAFPIPTIFSLTKRPAASLSSAAATARRYRPNRNGRSGAALDIFAVGLQGTLMKIHTVPLPQHARTGLFVPERRAIYIAARRSIPDAAKFANTNGLSSEGVLWLGLDEVRVAVTALDSGQGTNPQKSRTAPAIPYSAEVHALAILEIAD